MHIKTIPVGQLQTNCYVVTDTDKKVSAIIDPGDESHLIVAYLEENGLTPQAIFFTHGHYDHTMAADDLVRKYNLPVYINRADTTTDTRPNPYRYLACGETKFYENGDEIAVAGLLFQVMGTPGHSPGSVCLRVGNCLFTGDTLFKDDCGRTDLPGGNGHVLLESMAKIHNLTGIEDVFPGHLDATTLERERRFNVYLRRGAGL